LDPLGILLWTRQTLLGRGKIPAIGVFDGRPKRNRLGSIPSRRPREDGNADDDERNHDRPGDREPDAVERLGAVFFLKDNLEPVCERLAQAPEVEPCGMNGRPEVEPALLGPIRSWTQDAVVWRSSRIRYATVFP